MRAKSLQDYKNAWQWHIDQLASLALAADIEYNDYVALKATLENWLNYAVKHQVWTETNNG